MNGSVEQVSLSVLLDRLGLRCLSGFHRFRNLELSEEICPGDGC